MKNRLIPLFLLGIMLLAGCKPQKPNVKFTLSDEQLARLMFDVQLSEVAMAEAPEGKQDSLMDLFWLRLVGVYKHSKPEIIEEIRKLENDPDKMKLILDRVQVLSDSIR